jgi:iron complex outermembrane receptor protein
MNKKHIAVSALSLMLSMAFVEMAHAAEEQSVVPAAEPATNSQLGANTPAVTEATVRPTESASKRQESSSVEQDNRLLREMVVSANKDKPVQQRTELGKLTVYTPVSGAVVGKDELEHLQLVNNLLELGKRVPGISMVRNMRIPDGGKQYTETRIDGMRAIALNTSGLDGVELGSVERIDVITGPASALYGTGALGGTISVTSRQPPADLSGKVSQEFGSWGFKRSQGNVGATTEDGRFGFIVTGSKMDYDGWRKNGAPANDDSAAEHKHGYGVKSFFRVAETTKIYAGLDQLMYDYRWAGPISLTQFNQDWRQTLKGAYGQSVDKYNTKQLRLQQFVGERGEYNTSWGQIHDDSTNYGGAGSGSSNNVICDDGSTAAGTSIAAGATVRCSVVNHGVFSGGRWSNAAVTNTLKYGFNRNTTTTAVYRHEFDVAKSNLYVGTDIYETIADSATYNNVYNALQAQVGYWAKGAMTSPGSMTIRRENTPFVHVEFSPMDKVRLHLGERFSRITDVVDDRTSANKDQVMTKKGNVLRSGVTYEFTQEHLVWSNLSQTYNPPAISTLLSSGTKNNAGYTPGADLAPEKAWTQEVGFRGRFENAGLQYDVALFHTTARGFVVSRNCTQEEANAINNGVLGCLINENAGTLTAKGLESMLSWAVNSWLDTGATYTNSRAYYDSYKTTTVDYTGKTYQAMPKHRLNLRAAVKPAPGWQVELEGDYMSTYFVDTANTGTYSRPTLFNLRANYRPNKTWSWSLHVVNLTNQQYATRVGSSTIAGVTQLAASAGQGNSGSYLPRTLRAGVSYSF